MTSQDFEPEQKKQLIQFYKAIKMASTLLPGNKKGNQNVAGHLADQVINELKKDNPDPDKIQTLTENLRSIANPGSITSKPK